MEKAPHQRSLSIATISEILRGNRSHFCRIDGDKTAVLATVLEADHTRDLREKGVVLATANIQAGLQRCAALANDDAAAEDCLAAEYFHAKPLRV